MFESLRGRIVELNPTNVVIQAGHFSYRLQISLMSFEALDGREEVELYTHLYVRNEGQNLSGFDLYGFVSREERLYFSTIIGVSGIGTSTARLMLSSLTPHEIRQALFTEDVNTFTKIKGLGPKTAKRLILELKDKIPQQEEDYELPNQIPANSRNTIQNEALNALTLLGFSKKAAQKAIDEIMKNSPVSTVEELVKLSLKKL